jgi:uncharacterized small protein (DUF1192 family)
MTREPPLWQTLQEPIAARVALLEAEVERLRLSQCDCHPMLEDEKVKLRDEVERLKACRTELEYIVTYFDGFTPTDLCEWKRRAEAALEPKP